MMNDPDTAVSTSNPDATGTTDAVTETPPAAESTETDATQGQANAVVEAAATDDATNPEGKEKPEGEEEETATGAPETYENFAVPEGFVLEGERLGMVQEFAKSNNWTQGQAQAAVDKFAQAWAENEKALESQNAQRIQDWGKQARDELGDKFETTAALAKTTVQNLENPKLLDAFVELGWGNHPELIKAFAHFGKLGRDSPMDGVGSERNTTGEPKTLAQRMYPNQSPKT